MENIEGNPENYNHYYQGIRACNIFLANIPTASVYSEEIRNSFKAQVLTLRAFYYLQLVKRYGGVPVITTPDYDYTKVKRGTFGECARQILTDCQDAIDIPTVEEWGWRSLDKENYRHVMTKAICAAIRSQIALYAASPCTMTEQSPGKKLQKSRRNLWTTAWQTTMNFIRNSRMPLPVTLLMMFISTHVLTFQ
ncbi:RagB/SusD family nutrient uptake outer membrane protein [Bacteroides sp. CR5/BHMF/2]|nr:RagB/SusD family nutrient uptake outer membrane protein [Bacteroides sp. CR5/BHMF/2]